MKLDKDYILVVGLGWVWVTIIWKSNIVAQLHYFTNVFIFQLLFVVVYHIGKLRGTLEAKP